jgi:N-acetylneuraminate synthase
VLESLGAPAYKIASFEAIDLPLIARVARTGKPMIISTGMANLDEIAEAVGTARENGCDQIVLLHCVSSYPAPDEQSNVRTVPDLAERFGVVSGLSDHSFGSAVAVASIALGGCVVEKHFTLRRSDGGPDAAFSLEPEEFRTLVEECKRAWRALGQVTYDVQGCERGSVAFRRSLYVVQDIASGEELTRDNVRSIRPGYGLSPKNLPDVLGRRAARDLKRGEPLDWPALA